MKKYTSVAALALRLTALPVLGLMAVVGGFQWLLFDLEIRDTTYLRAFQYMMDDRPALMGLFGLAALVLMLRSATVGTKRSQTAYTIRRLQLSEDCSTLVFGLVFVGWFVLYWAFQIAICLALFSRYTDIMGEIQNMLFVSAFRSQYFHNLLPLYEPWALVRNCVLCLSFGGFAALAARNTRNGKGASLLMFSLSLFACTVLYPDQLGTQVNDISLSVIVLVCLAIDIFWTRRWSRDEAN